MADQLCLSYWLRGFTGQNMLRHWEKALRLFPYSRLSVRPSLLRIYALEYSEPPLLEQAFDPVPDPEEILASAREFQHADCAYQLDACWDIWQREADWELAPSRVSICCFGPDFDSGGDEQIRLECGLEVWFLPGSEEPGGARMIQSNIRSLLRLARDLDGALPAERRTLWSDSGHSFVERLQRALEEDGPTRLP